MAMIEHQREPRASSSDGLTQLQFVHDLRKQYDRRRRYELSACAVGFVGILLMLAQNEILMSDTEKSAKRAAVETLKWIISLSTALLMLLVVLQFTASSQIKRMQSVMIAKRAQRRCGCSARHLVLALELLICGFHIPPSATGDVEIAQFHSNIRSSAATCPTNDVYDLVRRGNACYLVYKYAVEAFGVFMILRLYLFARYMRSASTLYSQWVAFIGALNDVNAMRPFFHFKALFKIKPLHLLVPLTLLNTFLTAAVIRILESPVQPAFESYGKSVWLTAVTLSATGFGDYYPVTYIGRAVTTISAMFGGLLLVALIQSLFFGVLELSPKEQRVKHLIDMDRWEKATQQNAAALLQLAWRHYRLAAATHERKSGVSASAQQQRQLQRVQHRLFAHIRTSRSLRMAQPVAALSIEDQFADMTDAVLAHVDRMEDEKQRALARIQQKVTALGALKRKLEASAAHKRVSQSA